MQTDIVLTRDQVRRIDADAVSQLSIPGLLLMENAARGACDVLRSHIPKGRVVVLCGPGNNGGDGLAMARLLSATGVSAESHLLRGGKVLTGDAAANLQFLEHAGVFVPEIDLPSIARTLNQLTSQDWIVDALLGTGIHGAIRNPYDKIITAINASPAMKLAIDLPSGLDCDSGLPCGDCVIANETVTFVAKKIGFRNPLSVRYTGRVHVCHIGVPAQWLESWLQLNGITRQSPESA